MRLVSARLKKELLAELGHVHCPHCSGQHTWRLQDTPSMRLNSITAVAICEACGEQVFLKRMLAPDCVEAEDQAIHEYSITTDIYEKFLTSTDMGVVKPLGRYKSLVLFEHLVGAPPLSTLKTGEPKAAEAMMRRIAGWIAHLHQASGQTEGESDFAKRLANVSSRIEGQKLNTSSSSRALRFLQETFPEPGICNNSHRLLHGDMKPDNFLFDGMRLVGFDIDGHFRNLPEYDLAQFLSQYELSSCDLFGKMNEPRRRRLEDAFAESYTRNMPLNVNALQWMRVYFLLSLWLSWRAPSILHHLRWDPLFERRMRHCLDDAPPR